ncbi:unknown protein [Simkania negevensis Z]|uniref:Uncharacterized protein n=1 Tax=Simkania negevensis (strain ATCC VR-1471 / DSM 27360 / Z) TaxID=331113 RepID=F8L510_SIMNZ|nr:unknown protein [Simkania negevensis Z]
MRDANTRLQNSLPNAGTNMFSVEIDFLAFQQGKSTNVGDIPFKESMGVYVRIRV